MAVKFNIGDTIHVNQAFVQNTLASRTPTPERKALLEHLGRLGVKSLLVSKTYPIPLIRITIISNDSTKLLKFESENDLNSSFTFVNDFNLATKKVVNVKNGSSTAIPEGSFVYQTDFEGTKPQKPVVMAPKANQIEKMPIFGIAMQDIFVGKTGNVLVEGKYTGYNTENAATREQCYVSVNGDQVITIPGGDFFSRGVVIDASREGTIYLPKQPAGPYNCFEPRQSNGLCNNRNNHNLGKAGNKFRRLAKANYIDGKSMVMPTSMRPAPRVVSNTVFDRGSTQLNHKNATDYLWLWGQFLDHDIALTKATEEFLPIEVPSNDQRFTPGSQLPFSRSEYDASTGNSNPREQVNSQSSFIDASNVYGSTAVRTAALITNDGTGKLKTSSGNLLPINSVFQENEPNNHDPQYYLAGDVRANEHILLTAIHTIWVREHNRIADDIRSKNTHLSGDQIFQAARRKVIALNQAITYNEFLPVLLGSGVISKYEEYNSNTNPEIFNSFATAFYRLGHAMVSTKLLRLDANLNRISEGHTRLRDAFFRPDRLTEGGGIEPLLRGAAKQICQAVTIGTADELRNFLFADSGAGGQDLAARNIQRGRDHGLPSFNDCRVAMGLKPIKSFSQLTSDAAIKTKLVSVYSSMNELDPWVGALAEDTAGDGLVGQTIRRACKLQFEALRDGDRFWYECLFAGNLLSEINNTKLSDVIRRNTSISTEIQDNVFVKD